MNFYLFENDILNFIFENIENYIFESYRFWDYIIFFDILIFKQIFPDLKKNVISNFLRTN